MKLRITVDNKDYEVPKPLFELLLSISKERDYWKAQSLPVVEGEVVN